MSLRLQSVTLGLALWLCAFAPGTARAQSAENVAVVINDSSAASKVIGDYYVQKRHIPAANVLHITATPEETISRAAYTASIERPLAAAIARNSLQDRILYIVLTKGVPLRIEGSVGTEGTVASVDSELTLLYRRLAGLPVLALGSVKNPYFLGATDLRQARHFTHRDHDIYLVSRLDAFTVDEALSLVDAALTPRTDGAFVLDERAALVNVQGDRWLDAAADRIRAVRPDAHVILDKAAKAAVADGPVLGYASWGSTDPELRRRSTGQPFVNGSLAITLTGADARTFQAPPPDWSPMKSPSQAATWFAGSPQSLVGDLIRDGATGVAGSVAEPFLGGIPRPDILFPAYLAGFNLIESFYLATPFLSWQTVVIGDPLCGPFVTTPVPRAELEVAVDKATELPALFSARRLAVVRAALGADQEAAPPMLRAESRLSRGDTAGARTALLEAVKSAPARPGPQLQLAMMDEAAGDHASAVSRYRRVIELQPNDAIALNNLAFNLAVHGNDPAAARPLAERAVSASRRNPSMVDTLAWVEHLLGNNTAAAALLQEAIKRAPTNAEIQLHAAQVAAARGLTSEAAAHLQQALKRDPALASRRDVADLESSLKNARP